MPDWKDHVRAATIANINIASPPSTIDGVTPAVGDRILVKSQTTASENGIYTYGATLARTADALAGMLSPETTVRVSEGVSNAHTEWSVTTQGPINVGTTAIAFGCTDCAALLTTTDAIYFVSVGPKASDSNDGLSFGTPFATIGRALTALGTSPGTIFILPGTHNAPTGGITIGPRQHLRGGGAMATIIMGLTSIAGFVVQSLGSRSSIRDLWINGVPQDSVGVRVSVGLPVGSHTNECTLVEHVFVDSMRPNTIAFAVGDNTNTDVSETMLLHCHSVGNSGVWAPGATSIHALFGDSNNGNVCDSSIIGGSCSGHQYGVKLNGATLVSRGLNFGQSTEADIWLHKSTTGVISIAGGRSENSNRFLWCELGAFMMTLRIADYTVVALRNSDGKGIKVANAPLEISNVSLAGLACPQYIFIDRSGGLPDNDYEAPLVFRNVCVDHPFPFGSPFAHPGVLVVSENVKFNGDVQLQVWNRKKTDRWTRRKVIASGSAVTSATTPGSAFSMNARNFEYLDVKLSGNAGTFTLRPGDCVGQEVSICFEQDAAGGWTYQWPASCGWSGGALPVSITTARARQRCLLRWTGTYWEQASAVVDSLPPPPVSDLPVEDNFTAGNPYWLNTPSTNGTRTWEHVPGGGSFGINGGKATCVCLGTLGDKDNDQNNGISLNSAAAAVYDTGATTTPTGIQADFIWQAGEGIMTNYLDDMTYVLFLLLATQLRLLPYVNGVPQPSFTYIQPLTDSSNNPVTLTAGSSHSLLVKITATGYEATLDGGTIKIGGSTTRIFTTGASEFAKVKSYTRHGIVASSPWASFSKFKVS